MALGTQEPVSSHPETDTSNLIFASVAGLLKQWPNSFFPSGHSVVPGLIPRGTRLYHGTTEGESPPNRTEWLGFDPYISYVVHSRNSHWKNTQLQTYVATRPLRVIYFDGQSASLGAVGHMDSQNALINGFVSSDPPPGSPLANDYLRADELCLLGREWGFEGVVRQNTGFEVIWCDFQIGIEFSPDFIPVILTRYLVFLLIVFFSFVQTFEAYEYVRSFHSG